MKPGEMEVVYKTKPDKMLAQDYDRMTFSKNGTVFPAAFSLPVASVAALGTFAAALFVAMRGDGRDGVR
mgnify:CR=1 FL=1